MHITLILLMRTLRHREVKSEVTRWSYDSKYHFVSRTHILTDLTNLNPECSGGLQH